MSSPPLYGMQGSGGIDIGPASVLGNAVRSAIRRFDAPANLAALEYRGCARGSSQPEVRYLASRSSRNGAVSNVQITTPSGNYLLDTSARQACDPRFQPITRIARAVQRAKKFGSRRTVVPTNTMMRKTTSHNIHCVWPRLAGDGWGSDGTGKNQDEHRCHQAGKPSLAVIDFKRSVQARSNLWRRSTRRCSAICRTRVCFNMVAKSLFPLNNPATAGRI